MLFLNRLSSQHAIPASLYNEVQKSLQYDTRNASLGIDGFIESLPAHLKMALTLAVHDKTFRNHPLFRRLKSRNRLLAWIGSRFRPWFNHAGTFIYQQGDDINQLFIVTKGMAAFVAPRFARQIFAIIDPSISDQKSAKKHGSRSLKYIGYEDSVVNHTLLIRDIHKENYDDIDLDRRANASVMAKRFFTVQAI